jgi:hypothetical protein
VGVENKKFYCIIKYNKKGWGFMTVKEFKAAYKHFLIHVTKHSKHSADKYVSYINKACHLPGMYDFWERLAACVDPITKTAQVEALCDTITVAFDDPACPITGKDLRDSQSSAHVLLAFVSGQLWEKHKGIRVQFISIYNKNTLRSKFLSRLTTQDRIYSFGAFPINIVNGLANKRRVPLFEEMISKIKFIYDDQGNFFYFKDIDRVMLATDGHACLEKDGKVYHIYTQVPKQTPPEYRLLQAPKIDELSLDHDNPVEKELKKAIGSMPTLQLLSTDIQIFKQNYKKTHKKADNRTVLAAYKKCMSTFDEDALIQEIKEFLSSLSLTIMQRNLNSAKSNRIP